MDGYSTLTQKGQVAIPKAIRDHFKLKPSDKLHFSIKNDKIIAERVPTVDEMFGSVKTKKTVSKAEYKKTIKNQVITKFLKKNASNT